MKIRKFEYIAKDVPMLKRDMALRFVYFFLFLAVCALQVFTIVMFANQFTTVHYVISCFVAVMSLIFALLSIWYATNDVAAITAIKRNGHYVKSSPMLFAGKNTFFTIYYYATKVFTIIMVAVSLSAITYSVLQYIYYQTFSLFIPAILLLTVISFHGTFQADAERRIYEGVQEYNAY